MSGQRTVNIPFAEGRLGKARVVGFNERRQERAARRPRSLCGYGMKNPAGQIPTGQGYRSKRRAGCVPA